MLCYIIKKHNQENSKIIIKFENIYVESKYDLNMFFYIYKD